MVPQEHLNRAWGGCVKNTRPPSDMQVADGTVSRSSTLQKKANAWRAELRDAVSGFENDAALARGAAAGGNAGLTPATAAV